MFDKIKNDLLIAMKEKDKFKLDVIRMLKSSIQMEAIKENKELSDDEVISVIKREVKKKKSNIEEYEKYNKIEMVENLKKEIEILNVYLPEEIGIDKLEIVIDDIINEIGAETKKDMGKVIKEISLKYGNQVDMSIVSKIVSSKLS